MRLIIWLVTGHTMVTQVLLLWVLLSFGLTTLALYEAVAMVVGW